MINKNVILIISGLFLLGVLGRVNDFGAIWYWSISRKSHSISVFPALSFGVKQATGKFPVEHVIVREKERLAKKAIRF